MPPLKEQSTVLLVSDLHVGKKTKSYGIAEFRGRMRKLYEEVLAKKKEINRSYRMPDFHIFLLGDIIDGEVVYSGQSFNVEDDAMRSVDIALEEISEFIERIKVNFSEVYVYTVAGNHGLMNKYGSERSNWDNVLYRRLSDVFSKDDKVVVKVNDKWYGVENIRGHGYMYIHGDVVRSYQNIPLYGIVQKAMRWKTGGIDKDFDVVLMGHFHTQFMMRWNSMTIICNGTFVTDDDYAEKMGLKSQTKMWMFGVGDGRDEEITWSYSLDVLRDDYEDCGQD